MLRPNRRSPRAHRRSHAGELFGGLALLPQGQQQVADLLFGGLPGHDHRERAGRLLAVEVLPGLGLPHGFVEELGAHWTPRSRKAERI